MTDSIQAADIAAIVNADVPIPAGAKRCDPWMQWADESWCRMFDVATLNAEGLKVYVGGMQRGDGSVEYSVGIERGEELSADEARALAALLVDAAAVIDKLTR